MNVKQKSLIALSIIFAIGLFIRIYTVFKLEIIPVDALQYMEIGQFMFGDINSSYVTPREPIFPFFIGLCFLILPNTFLTMRIITAILGSIIIILIFLLACRIFKKKSEENNYHYHVGLVSSLLVCFNDQFVAYDTYGVREQLFSILLILFLYSLMLDNIKIKRILLPILALLLYLTKNEALILLIGVAILDFYINYVIQKKTFIDSIQNSLAIIIGTIIGFIVWGALSIYLFSDFFSTSNWMAKKYFKKEFNINAPEDLTVFSFLFQYHGFTSIIKSFFYGVEGIVSRYLRIYGLILFPFFILFLIKSFQKNEFINLWISIYPILFIGIFAQLYGWAGFVRIIVPYAIIIIPHLSNGIFEIIDSFEIQFTRKHVLPVKSLYFVWVIVSLICIIKLIEIF